jgi:aminoglycoside phosphotransferase (APT) family kinase protein
VAVTLDIENHASLRDYLLASGRVTESDVLRFSTLAGGVSNRTVLVERSDGPSWVMKQALAKLRTSADWFSDPARVHREALGIRWLTKLAPPGTITPLVFEDFDHHLIAMHAVSLPHENWKAMLMAGNVQLDQVQQFARLLATIHVAAAERAGELREVFDDVTYFESLRLEPYYGYASQQVPQAASFLVRLIDQTRARRQTLVHGDYSPKNILVHNGRLVLLDHEVIHWGDPAFDLGFALAHLLSKARHLAQHRDIFAGAAGEFVRSYAAVARSAGFYPEITASMLDHTLGCLLARVAGRSPLEYLSSVEKATQQRAVLSLMLDRPRTMDELIKRVCDDAHD